MYHDSVLHALTQARRQDLLDGTAHARTFRTARGRAAAHRTPGMLRRLTLRAGNGHAAVRPTTPRRPAEQAL